MPPITSPVQPLRIYHAYISTQRDESSRPRCGLYIPNVYHQRTGKSKSVLVDVQENH